MPNPFQAPPSPDYVSGPKEPEQAPPSPDYVPGPEHADDEIVTEDQPYAKDASPTAQSHDYVPESNPEVDLEEDGDEDPKEDPVDYPANGGDDDDDEEGSSEDDEDDDMDIEADDEEKEEEHLAHVDSVVVALPATDQASSAKETEPFETDKSAATPPPHPSYRVTARISIPTTVHMLGNPQMDLQDQGVIDSGCSRHMIENMSYLTNYEKIDGGYVAFGGNHKGGKIIGKVVKDDYSRFTWVFFLATKDETSGILKSFITGIENLVDHKVKVIRCDNGTEFKNR
ncbi:putative reverse transcriptase domain-containing protein [Tanacetum coccineum]|uniref:Reverse transcriptase domain-containing protein n=1 Tax=Tanacetum coccineum TaxID=301880 RepID=A0ABQ5E9H1_9ASTR